MRAGTIVASNYAAMARVLGESFLDHHPGSTFHVLVIDDLDVDFGERIEVARLGDLDLDAVTLDVMKTIYDVMEFATSVKPSFLRFLLDRPSRSSAANEPAVACYLDPDIVVYANFDDRVAPAVDAGIVLTPHALEPIPRDGMAAAEGTIMQSGMYNCGFLAVSESGREFLDWWDVRLRFDAVVDFENSYFTDQRWVDWVPSLFDHHICRDAGMNIAWWNIHERPIDTPPGAAGPATGDVPVRFVHFSGYDPTTPDVLSKHQGSRPRVAHAPGTGMRALADDYAERLISYGHVERRRSAYPWNVSASGVDLDRPTRRRVRAEVLAELEAGATLHDRSTPDAFGGGALDFDEWLSPIDTLDWAAPVEAPPPAAALVPDAPAAAARDAGPGSSGVSALLDSAAPVVRRVRSVADRVASDVAARRRARSASTTITPVDGVRPFAFLHVPKSAGSSIVASLRDALDSHRWAPYGYDPAWFGPYRNSPRPAALDGQILEDHGDLAMFDAVAGHFTLPTLLTRFDSNDIATVLREPRCRLLSHYEYWRGLSDEMRVAERPWASSDSAIAQDFAEWLADESIAYQSDNTLIRQLVDDPAIPDNSFIANAEMSRLARRAVKQLRTLGFVGLVEQGGALFDGLGEFVGADLERRRINVTGRGGSGAADVDAIFERAIPALAARTAGDSLVWAGAARMLGIADPEVTAQVAWMRRVGAAVRAGAKGDA